MKIVVISDLQVPFHNPKAVKNVATFIRKFKPDEVLCVGDEIDFQTISRWSSGFDEHSKTIGADRDMCVDVMYDLQITQLSRSNHGARLFNAQIGRALCVDIHTGKESPLIRNPQAV